MNLTIVYIGIERHGQLLAVVQPPMIGPFLRRVFMFIGDYLSEFGCHVFQFQQENC